MNPLLDYEHARALVANATGSFDLYIPNHSSDREEVVKTPLVGELTRADAVKAALMNNKDIQSLMYEIGMSHADAVQVGLLSNPSLNGVLRFPTGDGASTFEASLLQSLFAVFRRPAQQRMAKARLGKKTMEVAFAAASVAAEASTAYINALIANRAKTVAIENAKTARELLFIVQERLSVGIGTQLDINTAEAEAVEQDLLREQAELNADLAMLALSGVMGVEEVRGLFSAALTTVGQPEVPHQLEHLLALAEKNRLDYRARKIQVDIEKQKLRLEKRKVLREGSIGASVESRGEGTELGPAFYVELPLFDQNQAQIATAEYRLSQALAKLDAQRLAMRNDVRFAMTQHRAARRSVDRFEKKLLPLRTESLALAREAFSEGKTNLLFVLESQRQLLQARIEYLSRLNTYLTSVSAIEKAVGVSVCGIINHLKSEIHDANHASDSMACSK
ncbi:MAG: TolC family protein [Pirellulaceae bacterium]|nr:TolC family protein [Pirellulaceae bacterium]